MKLHRFIPLLLLSCLPAQEVLKFTQSDFSTPNKVIIETPHTQPEAPLFYTANVEASANLTAGSITEQLDLSFLILQGKASVISLEIIGDAPIIGVQSPVMKSWAIRREGETRFIDFIPLNPSATTFNATINTERKKPKLPANYSLTTFGPGKATSLMANHLIQRADDVRQKLVTAEGFIDRKQEEDSGTSIRVATASRSKLEINLSRAGAQSAPAELLDARLVGAIDPEGGSGTFNLIGDVVVTQPTTLRVLSGRAAPIEAISNPNYRLKLVKNGYALEFKTKGTFAIDLAFVTPIQKSNEWSTLQFTVPGGAVVPIKLTGLPESAEFNPALATRPTAVGDALRAFLPATGQCHLAWQTGRKAGDGKLFFTTSSMGEISVGAGLLRQMEKLTVKALQGSLSSLNLQMAGSGEVLAIEGENVLGWSVNDQGLLAISLSRAVEKEASFIIRSQTALDALPVESEPLRFTPVGAVRHSGHLRIYHRGAVRIEVMKTKGLTQLSLDQYPEAAALPKSLRQIFHYRYPSKDRAFTIAAERVKPEINLSQSLNFTLTETDRVLRADLELEIREAAIREWELTAPGDYSVVSVTGADVADYVASAPENGVRRIKVIFAKEVSGRRLIRLHLEKNEPAKAGSWQLPVLAYSGSQAVRGEIGVSAAPGFRITPSAVDGLSEMPLNQLLKRSDNLQQAFRIRGEKWTAALTIDALSQNVQADVFHLYSLKEGRAYVSVLLNYFVTGAPVSAWQISLPESIENLSVDGRDVRDSLRGGENETHLTVPLHRPVMGAYQLLVTYEQPANDTVVLGSLTPLAVQGERGYVQVVSPGQVELSDPTVDEKLIKLDPLELPTEYQLMSHAPTLAAWQYNNRPVTLGASISWFTRGETAKQIVEYAAFSSRIARDGGVVTESIFHVRTRGSRTIGLEVPKEILIREVTVDGQQVTIRESGDQRLIPLPESVTANKPVQISVRSSSANSGQRIHVTAPMIAGTTQLMTTWKITPDSGHLLEPVAASGMKLLTSYSHQSGFTWIEQYALISFTLLVITWVFGTVIMRIRAGVSLIGAALVLFAAAGAFYLSAQGFGQTSALPDSLEYTVPVTAPGQSLGVIVEHVEAGVVGLSDLGLFLLLLAVGLFYLAWKWAAKRSLILLLAGLSLMVGLLSFVTGAGWFFALLGVTILILWWKGVQRSIEIWKDLFRKDEVEDPDESDTPSDSPSGLTALLVAALLALSFGNVRAEAADSLSEIWSISDQRLTATAEIKVTGKAGEKFLLLRSPATLTSFEGENLKVVAENDCYNLIPLTDGSHTATFTYQAPATHPSDIKTGVPVLTGLAAVRSLTVSYEAAGWSIESSSAVRTQVIAGEISSAKLWLAPETNAYLVLRPKARDVAGETTQFYAELSQLFIPGPGVIDGRHLVRIRPAQGQVKELVLTVPEGFTISEVGGKPVGPWRFDPEQRLLTVAITPVQSQPFQFFVETQRSLGELPAEATVAPMRVQGAAGEVGMLALAFGREAQLDQDTPQGMSLINLADFGGGLLPRDRENKPSVSLQKAYRYAKAEASLKLKVTPVAPEVRVSTEQILSIGDERILLNVQLTAAITRAGIFRLSFPLPKGFEVETLTGAALNHWAETQEGGKGIVTMNLNGKTLGQQTFSVVLASATPKMPATAWAVPKLELREAERQAGQLVLIPGRGIQLRVEKRKDVSALDPRKIGKTQAGALAFRLLQKSWNLGLAIDQLSPSIAAQILHDVELRDSRSMSRLDCRFSIDNASIRELEVRLPGLAEIDAQTVRASGSEVRDILNIEGDLWRILFKRRVIGVTAVRIEYEQNSQAADIRTALILGARQQESYLSLRPGARLEVSVDSAVNWSSVDWGKLPKSLRQIDRSGTPAILLRSRRPGAGVQVSLKSHAVVSASRIRVLQGELLTVVSQTGELMNQAELKLETSQRGSLTLTLPASSRLFGVFVNGESANVVQDGEAYRFQVSGDAGGSEAKVRFTYSTSLGGVEMKDLNLQAFKIGEPLENVTWVISVPEGYLVRDSAGDLDLIERDEVDRVSAKDYQGMVQLASRGKEAQASARLNQVSLYLKAGEQEKAAKTLEQVYNGAGLDRASNEDAGVKLESLVTQQAVVGLNTRRQRMFFDNFSDEGNDQLQLAADQNPVFAGNRNFGRDDYHNVIQRNDATVNRMLSTIAQKWVRHQRLTEPLSQMLDPVIPAGGKKVTFTRAIQVDGDNALKLSLAVEPERKESSSIGRFWLLVLIVVSLLFAKYVFSSKSLQCS